MTKKKKLAKDALKHPENFSFGELAYFHRWLQERKLKKAAQKREKSHEHGGDNVE